MIVFISETAAASSWSTAQRAAAAAHNKPTSPQDSYPPFKQLINSPHISYCGFVISNHPKKRKEKKEALHRFVLINAL